MPQRMALLGQRMLRVRPWVAFTVVLAVVLFGYYIMLGAQYWMATTQASSLSNDIQQSSGELKENLPGGKAPLSALELSQRRLEELRASFTYQHTEALMAAISTMAQETKVNLMSITSGDPQGKVVQGIDYQVQPVSVVLQGDPSNISRFLSGLHRKVPVTAVSDITLSLEEVPPRARLQLLFFVLAQSVSEEKGAKR